MRFKFVYFDLDGTLADNYDAITSCIASSIAPLGYAPFSREKVKQVVGGSILLTLQKLIGERDAKIAVENYVKFLPEHEFVGLKKLDYSNEILRNLKSQGVKLACLTNKSQTSALNICKHLGFYEDLDFVIGTTLYGSRKPEPAFIKIALEKMEATPHESAIVGDSIYDYKTALAGGLTPIIVATGGNSFEELTELCPQAKVFRSLKEVERELLRD